MKIKTFFQLARISNLPTVWTNVFTGVVLANGQWQDLRLIYLLAAMSLFYVAGMFLNDAFDHKFDAQMRQDRPIPRGEVTVVQVSIYGISMMIFGLILLFYISYFPESSPYLIFSGLLLVSCVIFYDAYHKSNPISPLIMGLCRMLVYITAALTVTSIPSTTVYAGAGILLCYLIGLTYAAKSENLKQLEYAWPLGLLLVPIIYGAYLAINQLVVLIPLIIFIFWIALAIKKIMRRNPGDIPSAIIGLIAGVSLLDAIILAGHHEIWLMTVSILAFLLTLKLQRWVSGT